MKVRLTLLLRLGVALYVLPSASHAQEAEAQLYARFIDPLQRLKQGISYEYVYPQAEGHPFLGERGFSLGTLWYEGNRYDSLLLNYDVYNDLLVIALDIQARRAYLIVQPAKVQAFRINGQRFLPVGEGEIQGLPGGYYQLGYEEGSLRWLVQPRKAMINNASRLAGEDPKIFVREDAHFVVVNRQATPITHKQDLLRLFPEVGGLKARIKETGARLKPGKAGFENEMYQIMAYISQNR